MLCKLAFKFYAMKFIYLKKITTNRNLNTIIYSSPIKFCVKKN